MRSRPFLRSNLRIFEWSSCIPCGNLAVGTPPKEMSFFFGKGGSFSKGRWFFKGSRFITWLWLGKIGKVLWFFDLDFFHACTEVAYGAYIPTLTAPFIGNAPGVWEDLRPPNRSCWRLINDDYTSGGIRDDGGWWGMMVVERWKGKNNKNRSQKEKEKDFGGKNGKGS